MLHGLATSMLHTIELAISSRKPSLAYKELWHLLSVCELDRREEYKEQMKLATLQMKLANWEAVNGIIFQTARKAITEYSRENKA